MPQADRSAWEAVLANGEVVTINDHVYVAPPWSERDGAPYSIARIIELVPASAARQNHGAKRAKSHEKHARLALFYRPSEISGRASSDHRLLYAAIHSEVHPVSWLRGKCYVRHRDKIESIHEWKKKSDHFHYVKLFDPYIRREYEMLRTAAVNNIPADVKAILVQRYEFLVTEKEMVADLTDTYRTCRTCDQWASSQESVRCDACKSYYHMSCVKPPLIAKPAKGYSWVCLPCAHRRAGLSPAESAGSSAVVVGRPSKGNGKGKDKERMLTPPWEKPDAFYRGWNFRYFGQYTVAADTVDPDDPIFPRNATRLGVKYQANVPSWDEQLSMGRPEILSDDPQEQIYDRGSDNTDESATCELLSRPTEEAGAFMQSVRALPLPLPPYDVEVYDRALYLFMKLGFLDALRTMHNSTLQDFRPIEDLKGESLAIFEREVAKWGFLEHHETAKLTGRKPSDIVRFYYKWRNGKLGKEHEASKQAKMAAKAAKKKLAKAQIAAQSKISHHMPMGVSANVAPTRDVSPDSDAEGSVWEEEQLDIEKPPACAICNSKVAKHWWKAPRSLTGNYLCDSCGTSYRKYGIAIPNKYAVEEALRSKQAGKRDGTPMAAATNKKTKVVTSGQVSVANTPPPAPVLPPPPPPKPAPCVLCRRTETKPMARCKNCSFSIHAGCYGIPKSDITPDWLCEPCANEKSLEATMNPSCVLCPKKLPNLTRPAKKHGATYDFDFLHAMKPTEGYKWAHILCSLFIPEVMYTDSNRLRVTEGISALPLERWTATCKICKQQGGAVIECAECQKPVHASCAWLSNYKFGFELVLAQTKPGKRSEAVPVVDFDGESRMIVPQCWCSGHSISDDRIILDMNQTEPQSGETALQMYAATYKQVPIGDTFGLLRKAERLERLMPPTVDKDSTQLEDADTCARCGVDVSPKWWLWKPENESEFDCDPSSWRRSSTESIPRVCHQCHFKLEIEGQQRHGNHANE